MQHIIKEKKQLAEESREELLRVVSKNGGHLASNLGVVELTIALYSILDFLLFLEQKLFQNYRQY